MYINFNNIKMNQNKVFIFEMWYQASYADLFFNVADKL